MSRANAQSSTLALSLQGRASNAAVRAIGLGKTIDERKILIDINFEVEPGAYVAILGANGAGKSTLLKVISTLTPPSTGKLELFGKNVESESARIRARVGLIGHQSMLYRDLSARENLEFFAKLYACPDPHARAIQLLQDVALSDRAEDPVKAFSRGMTQRLAIARALVHEPDLLLADEPFEGLDAPSSRGLEQMLAQIHSAGTTIVLVNHDIEQSLRLAQRVIVLRRGRVVIDAPAGELGAEAVLGEMQPS